MQSYIATASVADSSNMQWESFQDLGVSEDFDQTSEELLKSLFTFLVYVGIYDSSFCFGCPDLRSLLLSLLLFRICDCKEYGNVFHE
jgi:hypothetical protein